MNASEYQQQAARTLIDDSQVKPLEARQHRIVWNALGLAGEAGEVFDRYPAMASAWVMMWACDIVEYFKKGIFHEQGVDAPMLEAKLRALLWNCCAVANESDMPAKELGDVLWYAAALCTCLEIDMADLMPDPGALTPIMDANIEKLKLRFPDGWDTAASAAKADEAAA